VIAQAISSIVLDHHFIALNHAGISGNKGITQPNTPATHNSHCVGNLLSAIPEYINCSHTPAQAHIHILPAVTDVCQNLHIFATLSTTCIAFVHFKAHVIPAHAVAVWIISPAILPHL
jgi:hypothetical protein